MKRAFLLLGLFGVVVAAACSSPDPAARSVLTNPPDRATFEPVANVLEAKCGSLDCHGQTARNLRVYGHLGLRLDPTSRPVSKGSTTTEEYDATYLSVIGLEPELMSAVVADKGARPDRLTLVRKARGTEHHKGGTVWNEGDDLDTCLVSWLSGATICK